MYTTQAHPRPYWLVSICFWISARISLSVRQAFHSRLMQGSIWPRGAAGRGGGFISKYLVVVVRTIGFILVHLPGHEEGCKAVHRVLRVYEWFRINDYWPPSSSSNHQIRPSTQGCPLVPSLLYLLCSNRSECWSLMMSHFHRSENWFLMFHFHLVLCVVSVILCLNCPCFLSHSGHCAHMTTSWWVSTGLLDAMPCPPCISSVVLTICAGPFSLKLPLRPVCRNPMVSCYHCFVFITKLIMWW